MPSTGRKPVGPGVPDILAAIRAELLQQADTKTRDGAEHFFKEGIVLYGVRTPVVVKMAARYFKDVQQLAKPQIFALCEELLKSDYIEEAAGLFQLLFLTYPPLSPFPAPDAVQ